MTTAPPEVGPAPAPTPGQEVDLAITGMTCASCSARVERMLNRLDGVAATVNLATEQAHVRFAAPLTVGDLVTTVEKTGYGASVIEPEPPEAGGVRATRPTDERGLRPRLLVAADPVTDWGNPNVVRASKGTVFAMPCAAASTAEVLEWVAQTGITLVATTPDTDLLYSQVDLTSPVAVAVGSEKHGLTRAVLDAADHVVRLPMAGRADSLNVSVSAAVVLYEAVRQRLEGGQEHT